MGRDSFRLPIYLALAKQIEIAIPFPPDKRSLPEKPAARAIQAGTKLA